MRVLSEERRRSATNAREGQCRGWTRPLARLKRIPDFVPRNALLGGFLIQTFKDARQTVAIERCADNLAFELANRP